MNKLHTALATVTAIIMLSACDPVTAPPTVSSDGFEGFTVHRVIPDSPIGIDLIPAGVTSAEYQVVAVNIFGESPASEPVTARPAQRIRRR